MVKCAECGLLAVRNLDSQELCSPGETQRKNGQPPAGAGAKANLDITPICAVRAHDLPEEVQGSGPAHSVEVMGKDRECDRFMDWSPAYSPREHLEKRREEEQAERDRKWRQKDTTTLFPM